MTAVTIGINRFDEARYGRADHATGSLVGGSHVSE
jgi:hypothetical protein